MNSTYAKVPKGHVKSHSFPRRKVRYLPPQSSAARNRDTYNGAAVDNRSNTTDSASGGFGSTIYNSFLSLKGSPKELYITFILKFFESYGYFSLSQILIIYLHQEFGVSDIEAGTVYGIWGLCITLWGLSTAFVNDILGVRRSLMIGFSASTIASIILATATSKLVLYATLFVLLPLGNSMGMPMLTVGIKRYTTSANRGFAFGLYYSVMNVGAFFSGLAVDFFNLYWQNKVNGMSGNRMVILSTTFTYCLSLVITYRFLREIRVVEDSNSMTYTLGDNVDRERDADTDTEATETSTNSLEGQIRFASSSSSGAKRDDVFPCDTPSDTAMLMSSSINEDADGRNGSDDDREFSIIFNTSLDRREIEGRGCSVDKRTCSVDSVESVWKMDEVTGMEMVHIIDHEFYPSDTDSQGGESDCSRGRKHSTSSYLSPNCSSNSIKLTSSPNGGIQDTNPDQTMTVKGIVTSATFWRFVGLTLFLINLRAIFRHLDATLPTYLLRAFGPDYPKGAIYSINPFMIIWLTPIVAALTRTWPHFDMIKWGGYVSAASPLFMAVSTSTWAVVLFVVTLSLGESIWSPRLYDYTMSIAPTDREATFSTLAAAPLFVAKIPVGLLSGYLLENYLSDTSNGSGDYTDHSGQHPRTMWLIISLVTLTSPVCVTLFERWIREPSTLPSTENTLSSRQSAPHSPDVAPLSTTMSPMSPMHSANTTPIGTPQDERLAGGMYAVPQSDPEVLNPMYSSPPWSTNTSTSIAPDTRHSADKHHRFGS